MFKQIAPRIYLVEQKAPRQLHKFSVLRIMYHNPLIKSNVNPALTLTISPLSSAEI